MNARSLIAGGVILVAIIGATIFVYSTRQPNTTSARNNPPPVAQAPIVVQKIGKFLTLYHFGGNGCVTVFNLRGDWSSYPKGGAIKFISRETGQVVLRDKPGTKQASSLSAGDYDVCQDNDPKAWGVEIWM